MKHDTALAQWLREATQDERERVAALVGTSQNYLYQLASNRREPKVSLALRIAAATKEVARRGLPAISIEDLAPGDAA